MVNKRYRLIILSTIFLLAFTSITISAEEYDLEKLLLNGLKNNIEIKQLENEIKTINRNIQLAKARSGWQANMNINKELIEEDSIVISQGEDQLNLSANRKLADDKVTLNPSATYDFDGSEVIYGVNMSIDLYPDIPSESIKSLIQINNQLNQKKKELYNKKAELIKNWLDKYLQLVRLDERIDVLVQQVKISEDNLEETQKQVSINEAGQQELLQAEINLNETEYSLKQSEQQYDQIKRQLITDLRLKETEINLVLKEDNKVLAKLKQLTENMDINNLNKQLLIDNIVKNSSQFANIINQKEYLKQELEWLKKEDSPKVSLEGSYDSEKDFTASLNINYNIFDSGVQKLQEENKKQEIENTELSLEQLYQQTENNLDALIDQVELAQLNKESSLLKYQKEVEENKILKRQFEAGAIEENVLKNNQLNKENKLIDVKNNDDNIFLKKLELFILTSPDDIVEEVLN